jgi:hypothetical protein
MHRAGGGGPGGGGRAGSGGANIAQGPVACFGESYLDKPFDVGAIETDLVDALGRAVVAQFMRAIRRQYQQRHMA